MTDAAAGPGPTFSASETSSSRNPQDWGRAAARIFESLAEQARVAGEGPTTENMFDADVHFHVTSIEDGVGISGTWTFVERAEAQED